MRWSWPVRLCCLTILMHSVATPAFAYKHESRVPLSGFRGYFTASGSARYLGKFNERDTKHFEELAIEVKNVPVVPGTVLTVYVDNEMMGTLTVTKHQTGLLKVTSEQRKFIPRIDAGSSVKLMKVDGTIVVQ